MKQTFSILKVFILYTYKCCILLCFNLILIFQKPNLFPSTLPIISQQGSKFSALFYTYSLSPSQHDEVQWISCFLCGDTGAILFLGSVDASDEACLKIVKDIVEHEFFSCQQLMAFGTEWMNKLRKGADNCPEHRSSILQDVYSLMKKFSKCRI